MDQIDEILERYERDLKRADQGKCKKVSRCIDFRNIFWKKYHEVYKPTLESVVKKLTSYGHSARIEEKPEGDVFLGFTFVLVPRHLYRVPVDKYYPNSLWSSISFVANEHTLSVDVERMVRPNIEGEEGGSIDKTPKDEFNEGRLMEKVAEFLKIVFDETIVFDFRAIYNSLTEP